MPQTLIDLGKAAKSKYPGAYDHVDDAELGRQIQTKYPGAYDQYTDVAQQAPAPPPATPPEKSIRGFGANLVSSTGKFLGDVTMPLHSPKQTLEGITGLLEGMAEKSGFKPVAGVSHEQNVDALVDFYKDRYGSVEGFKNALYTDPFGILADVSTVATGFGGLGVKAAETVAAVTDPLRMATKIAGGVAKLEDKLAGATSRGLTRGALRGGYNINAPAEKITEAVDTANVGNTRFSQKGLDQITQSLSDLQAQKQGRTMHGAQAGMTIDPRQVVIGLQDLRDRLEVQAFPKNDLKQIDAIIDDFKSRHRGPISVDEAEALKEGTYAQNKYGGRAPAHMVATEKAEKTIAHVLKTELEQAIPELADLNAQQSKLLNLQSILKPAVNKYLNSGKFKGTIKKELFTPTGAIRGAGITGAGAFLGEPTLGVGAVAAHAVLSDPAVQQGLARFINKIQLANPTKYGSPSVKATMDRVSALATALSRANQEDQQ